MTKVVYKCDKRVCVCVGIFVYFGMNQQRRNIMYSKYHNWLPETQPSSHTQSSTPPTTRQSHVDNEGQ